MAAFQAHSKTIECWNRPFQSWRFLVGSEWFLPARYGTARLGCHARPRCLAGATDTLVPEAQERRERQRGPLRPRTTALNCTWLCEKWIWQSFFSWASVRLKYEPKNSCKMTRNESRAALMSLHHLGSCSLTIDNTTTQQQRRRGRRRRARDMWPLLPRTCVMIVLDAKARCNNPVILAQAAQRVERDAALRAPMPLNLLRMGVLGCAYIYICVD